MSLEIQLTDATFEKDVLQSASPVLVDFWAPWCGPCRMLAPIIEELAKEYTGKVRVGKLNTDEHPEAAGRYRISAIPTLLFFKGGKVVEQMQGVHPKAEIKKKLDSLVAG
ncbi:MAG: thioredoxin [Elusimicrobia bacterium]|nr:thioredoxin [Elusimicrobiota bacterium]